MRQLRPTPVVSARVHRERVAAIQAAFEGSEQALINLLALIPFAVPRHDGHRLESPTLPMAAIPRQRRPHPRQITTAGPPPELWPVRRGIRVPPRSMLHPRREGRP